MSLSIFEQAGINVTNQGSVSDVFRSTGLDWSVVQRNVYTMNNLNEDYNDSYNKIPRYYGNFRSDNNQFLGFVNSKQYKVVQNIEAFNFIDKLPNFNFEKVGMFDNGKKVFVVGKANDQIIIDGQDDNIDFYLTFLHGHDGKSGIRFIISPVRMFCMNQMNLMLKTAKFKYNITHTGNIEQKLNRIQNAISDSRKYVSELQNSLDKLINTKVNMSIESFVSYLIEDNTDAHVKTINRNNEARQDIIDIYTNKDDLQNYKGTAFGVLSAVSDFISHRKPGRISKIDSTNTINNTFIRNIENNELLNKAKYILEAA